jgi:surface antigen
MHILYKVGLTALAGIGVGVLYLKRNSISSLISPVTEASLRNNVVQAAISQLGQKNPIPYWVNTTGMSQPSTQSWCGAFALWALHQAGLAINKNWINGKGFLLTQPTSLSTTHTPKPGDIAYFDNYQHHAVVANVYPDGTIDLINGNGTNGAVTPSHPKASSVTAFYSIQPYIDQRLAIT